MVALNAVASAIKTLGVGFSNFNKMLAAFALRRLPDSNSIWAELSASDKMRPVWNLPASSNNAYMLVIVTWQVCFPRDNGLMSTVIHNPSLYQRIRPLLKGFDGPLAFGIFLLVCAGMLTMYSSGFANGARFFDHGRNILLAGIIMFVVAQIPPQRLMAFAVPL